MGDERAPAYNCTVLALLFQLTTYRGVNGCDSRQSGVYRFAQSKFTIYINGLKKCLEIRHCRKAFKIPKQFANEVISPTDLSTALGDAISVEPKSRLSYEPLPQIRLLTQSVHQSRYPLGFLAESLIRRKNEH